MIYDQNNATANLFEKINELSINKVAVFFSGYCTNITDAWVNWIGKCGGNFCGIVIDDILAKLCFYANNNVQSFASEKKYNCSLISDLGKYNDVILVLNVKIELYSKVVSYIKEIYKSQNNLHIFSVTNIKPSSKINGITKVFNRVEYLKGHPWYYDLIFNGVPIEERKVRWYQPVSNGKYFHTKQFSYEATSKHRILFIGNSKAMAHYIPERYTITECIQKKLDSKNIDYKVENHSVDGNVLCNPILQIKAAQLKENDVVICATNICYYGRITPDPNLDFHAKAFMLKEISEYCNLHKAKFIYINLPYLFNIQIPTKVEAFLRDAFGRELIDNWISEHLNHFCLANQIAYLDLVYLTTKKRESFFLDDGHYTIEGAKLVSNDIAKYLEFLLKPLDMSFVEKVNAILDVEKQKHNKNIIARFETPELLAHLATLKEISAGKPENTGVIVMNCNPFTLGHRYLIETAKLQVDHLYILVVEEDCSTFKFSDRLEMIKLGVADISGVDVLPSGQFVISTATFPEYFDKDAKQSDTIDPTMDVEVFCNKIAPALRVKKRFVGEEPLDRVTDQYNNKMAEILPKMV